MVRILLEIFLWITLTGFVTFCLLYAILAAPWKNQMGKYILTFMGAFALAFIYAAFSRYVSEQFRLFGWMLVLLITSISVWSCVYIFMYYQIIARRAQASKNENE